MKRLDTKSYDCAAGCPVEATLDLIDGKWKAVILYHLLGDTIRFNELGRRLSRITQRMLTRQLRELEAAGLIHREVYAEVPPRVEYSLTALGRSLEPVIRSLWTWGQNRASRSQRRLGFGATRKLGNDARALLASSRRQTAPQACVSMNMLFPLALWAAGTSSCITSQCSAILPLATRKMSTAIMGLGPQPV